MLFADALRTPFWQVRFYDFNVWTAKKRVEKLNYMHQNPVKRGPVTEPEDWRWSSFRFYALGESGSVAVNEGWAKISFREWAAKSLSCIGSVATHPCKVRKDRAPIGLEWGHRNQSLSHPPRGLRR